MEEWSPNLGRYPIRDCHAEVIGFWIDGKKRTNKSKANYRWLSDISNTWSLWWCEKVLKVFAMGFVRERINKVEKLSGSEKEPQDLALFSVTYVGKMERMARVGVLCVAVVEECGMLGMMMLVKKIKIEDEERASV
ncbi:hypothetical protein LguiB_020061 [Lonicera macranthoides]